VPRDDFGGERDHGNRVQTHRLVDQAGSLDP